jgi:hypothetical protein
MTGDEFDEEPAAEHARPARPSGSTRERRSSARGHSPSRPSGASLEGFDADPLWMDSFGSPEESDLQSLLPSVEGGLDVPPRLSPEIQALLAESLAHARLLPSGSVPPPTATVLVDERVLAELDELLSDATPRPVPSTNRALHEPEEPPPTGVGRATDSTSAATREGPTPLVNLPMPPTDSLVPTAREPLESAPPTRAYVPTFLPPSARRDTSQPPVSDARPPAHDVVASTPAPPSLPSASTRSARTRPPSSGAAPRASDAHEERVARDAFEALAAAVRERRTGMLELTSSDGARTRQIVLRDGDIVTAATSVDDESILDMLVERGDLDARLARERTGHPPRAGRHAAAALIAQGYVAQDELWAVLRAHAEWILGRALRDGVCSTRFVSEIPERLAAEPSVFGGSTGVEVFVEVVRRTVDGEQARRRLGERGNRFARGGHFGLIHEAGLEAHELEAVEALVARGTHASDDERTVPLWFALVELGMLAVESSPHDEPGLLRADGVDLDDEAVRLRVATRLTLVKDSDYFTLLGLASDASGYDIRRAYLELRRAFEPSRLLSARTRDLEGDVRTVLDVFEEAYRILSDETRRRRYRAALTASPR